MPHVLAGVLSSQRPIAFIIKEGPNGEPNREQTTNYKIATPVPTQALKYDIEIRKARQKGQTRARKPTAKPNTHIPRE